MPTGNTDVKCHIHVIGAPSIWTPAGQLATTKPLVFGAALYLGLHRGDTVGRTHLSALLWPDATDAARSERARWLVHQLRAVGLIGQARASEIELGVHEVVLDLDALADAASAADALTLAHGDVLSGYDPRISDTFSQWIDESRDALRSTVIRALDSWLTAACRTADWAQVEALARRILALDELHERATIALAEALALNGRHEASVQVLARYRTATDSVAGASAAHQLQERLQALSADAGQVARRTPLAGRREALAMLLDSIDASRPSSRRIGLAGPSGIGKTRLLDELTAVAQLRGTRVARIRCGRADSLRPLSLATDLARALLEVRGALGASPDSIETLRVFLGEDTVVRDDIPNEGRRAAVYAALSDLVGALADDGPLVVVIDDSQWAEPGSWAILAPLFSQQTTAALSWIIALRAETQDTVAQIFRTIFPSDGVAVDQDRDTIWLTPLERDDVAALCTARAAPRQVPPEVLDVFIRHVAGIPFVAEALVDHWMEGGDIAALPPSVARLVAARLDRLSPNGTCVLESVAVLGPDAGLSGLEAVCLIERAGLLDATRELETAGILRTEDGRFSAHALWTEAVRTRAPRTTLQVLHRYAAQWLGHETAVFTATDHRRHWAIATHWLEAGEPERARRALDRAAEVLAASGFAGHAAAMLERCAEIAGVSEATLHYWTRAAELWLRDQSNKGNAAVLRIHTQYDRVGRALDPSFSLHHEMELLAHVAFSRLYVSQDEQDEKARQCLRCATDPTASPTHRIHATVRILELYARSPMDRSIADAAWRAIESIVPATHRERLEADLCAARYFTGVADQPTRGVAHAERAQTTLSEDPQFGDAEFRRVLLILSDCYEYAGDLDRAQAARWELYERGKQSRNQSMLMSALDGLIGTALEAGHPAEARPLLTLLGHPVAETKSEMDLARTIHWVVCALEEGNAAQARAGMNVPLEEADIAPGAMPRARILAIYTHLALLEDDDVTAERLMPRLVACFSGRMWFMHHPAYVAAQCLHRYRGADAAAEFAQRFLDEIRLERWTPRDELLRFARKDPGAAAQASADMQNAKRHPRVPTPRKPKHT